MTTDAEGAARAETARGVWALLRKDLRVFDTRDAAVFLALYVLVGAQVARWDEAFFWVGVGLAGGLVAIVPIVEWLLEADRLLGSLPVRRSTIVIARYVSAAVACAVAAGFWMAGGRLLVPLLSPARTGPAMWESLDGVLTFFVVTTGLVAIFLPLYFRLALGRASMAFGAVYLALCVGSSAIARAAGAATAPRLALAPPSSLVRLGVDALVARLGAPAATALIVAGLAALLSFSGWLAVKGFERRDL